MYKQSLTKKGGMMKTKQLIKETSSPGKGAMINLIFQITVDWKKPKTGDMVLFDKRCHYSIGKYSAASKKYFAGVVVKQKLAGIIDSAGKLI